MIEAPPPRRGTELGLQDLQMAGVVRFQLNGPFFIDKKRIVRAAACGSPTATNCKYTCDSKNPRQELFRIKGGRGDGALKIGDLLIASKVPKASDLAKSRERPRNRFTAADFGVTFWPHKR